MRTADASRRLSSWLTSCLSLSLIINMLCYPIHNLQTAFGQNFCLPNLLNDRNPKRPSKTGLAPTEKSINIGRRGSSLTLARLGLFAAVLGLAVPGLSQPCKGARQNPTSAMRLNFASAACLQTGRLCD